MIEIAAQFGDERVLKPYSVEDYDALGEYHKNQLIRIKTYGVQKERSYQQLKLFWACCRKVAENTEATNWNTKEKAAESVKLNLHFSKGYVVYNGAVQVITRSISYKNLRHMEACNFFDRAFPVMAKVIGVSVDELLKEAQ